MSHEISVFLATAGLTALAGFGVRMLALKDGDSFRLEQVDFTKDFIAAAAAVFPTTLIIQSEPHKAIAVSPSQGLAILFVIFAIFLWGKGESRYLSYWREGKKRIPLGNGKLSDPKPADKPKWRKAMAFAVGNGFGFLVLFASAVLSQQVAS